jgi:hypothetical protein
VQAVAEAHRKLCVCTDIIIFHEQP